MTDPETPHQPLLASPNQGTNGGRSSRAYKVAGITLLACVLIAGQVMVAYFLLSQRGDIKSLQEQNNNLESQLTKGRSAGAPARMHVPMNVMPALQAVAPEEEASSEVRDKPAPQAATVCQMEAAGQRPVQVPNFRPECDEQGRYKPQQCFMSHCWCVNPENGQQIPGTMTEGKPRCSAPVYTGRMSRVLALPDAA